MNQDLIPHTLYCLYDIFFAILNEDKLVLLAHTSKEMMELMLQSGGFAKSIRFDWTCSFNDFLNRLSTHSRIDKMTYDGAGAQLCILEFLPIDGIKTLILKNNPNTRLIRETIESNQLRRRNQSTRSELIVSAPPLYSRKQDNCWAELEYLFITDSGRTRTFDIGMMNFPNLRFIGSYKTAVAVDAGGQQQTDKLPYAMVFKDHHSFELMYKKKSLGFPKIIRLLKKIYR